jgi:hypothetical protein
MYGSCCADLASSDVCGTMYRSAPQKNQEEIVKEKTVKKDEKKKPQKTLKEKRKAKREKENK